MVRWTRIAAIVGVVVLASGCGTMEGGNPVAPEAPALEMGGLGTGGNAAGTGGETGTASTTSTAPEPTATDTTTRAGGFGLGGN